MATTATVSRWRILESIRRRRQIVAHAHRQQQKTTEQTIPRDPLPSASSSTADLYDESLFSENPNLGFNPSPNPSFDDIPPSVREALSLLQFKPLPVALSQADFSPSPQNLCSLIDNLVVDKPILALQTLMWTLKSPNFDPSSLSSINLGSRISPLLPPPRPPSIDQFLIDIHSFWNNPSLPLPPHLLDPLLSLYCHASHTFEETLEAFELLISKGANPGIQHYNKVLKSAVSKQHHHQQQQGDDQDKSLLIHDLEKAQQLFNRMRRSGAPAPDIISYNILIYGYGISGNSIEAVHLFDEMTASGFPPNESTYSSLISGLVKTESLDRASQLLQEMKYNGLRPTSETYSLLLRGLCAKGNHNFAASLLKEMRGQGQELDNLTFNALLGSLSRALDINEDEARKLLEGDAM